MNRLFVILSLMFFIVTAVDSQTLLTGRVVSGESHKPLARVSVVAEDNAQKPLAYALTKSDGTFTLKVAEGTSYESLTFSLIGYAKLSVKAGQFTGGQTIVMNQEAYLLQEVEVRSQRIRQRNDTLSYGVRLFSQKQDRSIADVIAKMPGLEVTGDGVIRYQGKAISHFYIEGMDLMGRQYAMASENLSAKKVKEVQVLLNHQDVKTLQGTNFSDRAALNLVLEDDAKGAWTGFLEAGLGTTMQESDADRLLRDGRLMGMMFGGRMQSLSMYKWNNTGKSIKDEVRNLANDNQAIEGMPNITSNITLDAPDLAANRYLMNDSRLMATNWLRKIGKDGSVRLQLSGYLDQTTGNRTTETTYSDALGGIIMRETEHGENNASEWKGELEYKYDGKHLYVSNVIGGYIDFNNSWAETQINSITLRQEASPHRRWISDNLQIVKSTGNSQSLQLNGYAGYNYQPGTLLLADNTVQHVDQHDAKVSTSLTFQHKLLKRLNVSYLAGFDYSRQKFYVWHEGTARKNDGYTLLNTHVRPSLSMKTGALTYNASADIRLLNRHFGALTDTRLVAEPSLSVLYKMTARLQARVSYDYGVAPSSLPSMTLIPLFDSYRSSTTGTGDFFMSGRHKGLLRMEYSDPLRGLFCFLDGLFVCQDMMPVYNSSLNGIIYHREATGSYSNYQTWLLKGRVSKSLGSMRGLVSVNGDVQSNHYVAMMQGQQQAFRSDVYQAGAFFSLRPFGFLSIEEKSLYMHNRLVCKDNRNLDRPALLCFKHNLKLYLTLDKWQIGWTHDIYHSNDHSVSFTYFSDLQISYTTKTYEIGMMMGNIFGSNSYERRLTNTDATVCVVNSLRPRELMIKASLNL